MNVVETVAMEMMFGHSVGVGGPTLPGLLAFRQQLIDELKDRWQWVMLPPTSTMRVELENKAWAGFMMMDHFSGAATLHTPVLVFLDVNNPRNNKRVVDEFRYVATSYPDGRPPLIIECDHELVPIRNPLPSQAV